MIGRLSMSLQAVSVRRGNSWALREVSLELRPGERWALVGGNGAGKTQLLKLLSSDVWPTPTGREKRVYRVGRRLVDSGAAKPRIAYIGAELQDKYARYDWNPTVSELLATGVHSTDLLQQPITAAQRRRVAAMLTLCGLTTLRERRFLSLSYGQKRIALLARGLIQNPDWLLLDEFYNGLDTQYRRRIDGILEHARRGGQSWVASAHRAADIPRGTEGLIELRAGVVQTVKRLSPADMARLEKEADETRGGLFWGVFDGRKVGARAVGSVSTPGARAGERARGSAGSVGEGKGGAWAVGATAKSGARAKGRGAADHRLLVRIRNASLFVEYRAVLEDVNWELRAGEHWAVFGANGAGKSSFLKLLYGDLSPALGGSIERVGFPRGTPIAAWKRRVGFVSPELQTDYAVNVTVLDLVASGRYSSIGLSDNPTAADLKVARRWLEFFSLRSFAKRRPRELSYGQVRRALFARALAADPRILLLDEPLTGLDPRQRAAMKRFLGRLMRQRRTLIVAVHHPEDLPRGMTHALRLRRRRAAAIAAGEAL